MIFKRIFSCTLAVLLSVSAFVFPVYAEKESYYNDFSTDGSYEELAVSETDYVYLDEEKLTLVGGDEYPPLTKAVFPFESEEKFTFSFSAFMPKGTSDTEWGAALFGINGDSHYKLLFFANADNITAELSYCEEEGSFETLSRSSFPYSEKLEVVITVSGGIAYVSINDTPVIMCALPQPVSGTFGAGAKGITFVIDSVSIKNESDVVNKASADYEKKLYIPQNGISSMPVVMQFDGDTSNEYAEDKKREAVSIYELKLNEGTLWVYEKEKIIGTLEERIALRGDLTVPAFSISDEECAYALAKWISEKNIKDALVISEKTELIKIAVGDNVFVRGVVDSSNSITADVGELYKKTLTAGCNTVILSQRSVSAKTVKALKNLFVTVYAQCDGSNGGIYTCISSGCDGIIGNADKIIAYSEHFTERSYFGYTPVVSEGGDTTYAPANTMSAILKAAETADIITVDVCITEDGYPILYASDNTELLTENVSIFSTPLSELKKLTYKDERVQDETIPTLSEMLKAVKIAYPELVIHVRLYDDRKLTAQAVDKAVSEVGMQSRVIVLTQSDTVAEYINRKLDIGANCIKNVFLPSTLTDNEKIFCIESSLGNLNSAYFTDDTLTDEFLYHAYARGLTVIRNTDIEITSVSCEREPSGKIKVSGTSKTGEMSDLTGTAEFVAISGNAKYENGYVKGEGTFAVRVPCSDGYLYSRSISFEETKEDADVTDPDVDDKKDVEITKYVVFACCGIMVVGGFVFFVVLKKNAFKNKDK